MREEEDDRATLPPAVVVAGPTASGKSRLAAVLAAAFGGVVINADALQVYRDLAVLTARPGPAETAAAPHRLFGFLPAAARCSAGRWRALALAEMAAATAAGRLPVLVGGTGLYLNALEAGIAAVPPVPEAVREAAAQRLAALGPAGLLEELAARDPQTAARLHPNDRQRILRAWSVLEATGRPLSAWQAERPQAPAPYRFFWLVLLPPRAATYAACDRRLRQMVAAGALEEVAGLLDQRLDPRLPAMKAVGVPELARHLSGETDLDGALAAAQAATRRYAKRQTTWLRTQVMGHKRFLHVLGSQFSESDTQEIFPIIRRFVLTPF